MNGALGGVRVHGGWGKGREEETGLVGQEEEGTGWVGPDDGEGDRVGGVGGGGRLQGGWGKGTYITK